MEKFWLESDKIDLLTKGQFLKGDDKMLKDLNIINNQTIMILEKNVDEEQWAKDNHNNNITLLKDIFANIEEAFLLFILKECEERIEEAIEHLSDETKKEELFRKFKRSSVDVERTFVKDTFKSLFIDRFSSIEFYRLIFKLASLKATEIQSKALELIRLLKPNPILVQNIDHCISNMKEILQNYLLNESGVSNINNEDKQILNVNDDILSFDIKKIIVNPTPLNIYKFEVFVKLVRICFSKEDESKFDKKFEFQNKLIENDGTDLLQVLYAILSEDYKKKPESNKILLLVLLSTVISDYILAYYLINSQDPYKKAKQIFFHRDKSIKKDNYMNITLRKNYSTDNVFSQNQNVSFKTNKSPKSFTTPGFQSPSNLIRYVTVHVIKIDLPKNI